MAWMSAQFQMVICIQGWLTIECDQHRCATLLLGQLVTSALLRKKADRDRTKVMVDHKSLADDYGKSFKYFQGLYIDIGIDFHQLWSNPFALVNWFHKIGGQCIIEHCRLIIGSHWFIWVCPLVLLSRTAKLRWPFPDPQFRPAKNKLPNSLNLFPATYCMNRLCS